MRSNRFVPVLLALCALVLTAAPGAQEPAQKLSMPGFPALGEPAVITVVSTGAAPKKALRYTIPATQKARMEMSTTTLMAMNMGGIAIPMDMPVVKMGIDLGVTAVAPNGDITYAIAFAAAAVEGAEGNPMVAVLQSAIPALTTVKGSATISSRGVTRSSKLDVEDPVMKQLLAEMTSSIENLTVPFPEEAVGAGARWEVRQALISGGQTVFEKTAYEIVSIDGPAVSLKITSEKTAPPQALTNAALPGAEMNLDKLTGSGTGTSVVRLDSLVPTSDRQSTTSTSMTLSMGGQGQAITGEVTMKLTVAPAPIK